MTTPGDAAPPGAGRPRRAAWFHCFSGIAGDMALASLLDAGADTATVAELLGRLDLPGWELRQTTVLRGGLACTHVEVVTGDTATARTAGAVLDLIDRARLPDRVAERSQAVFRRLAEVEGRLHATPPSDVHFHEVGGHDAVVDVVGTVAALEALGIDEITVSPVAVGTGTVRSAHGVLPNPAPAVTRLLEGVPVQGLAVDRELTTPTGAALVAVLATGFGALPGMEVAASGFGAGRADPGDLPNCTQVVVGALLGRARGPEVEELTELAANLDDATGEDLAESVQALLRAGALDAWITPVIMKKGRPGHVVHALGRPGDLVGLSDVLATTTGSFGVRATDTTRWAASRTLGAVEIEGHRIAMKAARHRAKAEHDDLVAAARSTGIPVQELRGRAEEAWRRQSRVPPSDQPPSS